MFIGSMLAEKSFHSPKILCTLFFVSDRKISSHFEIMRARRKFQNEFKKEI